MSWRPKDKGTPKKDSGKESGGRQKSASTGQIANVEDAYQCELFDKSVDLVTGFG